MELVLYRRYMAKGTQGRLLVNGQELCKTIELPWLGNAPRISCIPEGRYALRKRFSQRYQWHLEVTGVRGRSLILFHAANEALKELKGCIAPVTVHTGEGKGAASRQALARLTRAVFPVLESGRPVYLTLLKEI